ncbi:hypothetical protein SAMN04488104_102039 [Algoriphagus faecimaris]|uniref:Uncharacterized protein n=1 Tax=Algoriphagus faecimaris TaxID=686796 RepID=A0A1G6T4C4_9BACT|nr:hypothetical protein SAMN04488104_102039 [Algoriphagus faecimaris]
MNEQVSLSTLKMTLNLFVLLYQSGQVRHENDLA